MSVRIPRLTWLMWSALPVQLTAQVSVPDSTTVFNPPFVAFANHCRASAQAGGAVPFPSLVAAIGSGYTRTTRTATCGNWISEVARPVAKYLDCPNWGCQVSASYASRGIVGGMEASLHAKPTTDFIGNSELGLRASLRYRSTDAARTHVEGSHGLTAYFLGFPLKLPRAVFRTSRRCVLSNVSPNPVPTSTTTFSTMLTVCGSHAVLIDWTDSYFRLPSFNIPLSMGPAGSLTVDFTQANWLTGFAIGDHSKLYSNFVGRTIPDDADWSWLVSEPNEDLAPLAIASGWNLDIITPGLGATAGLITVTLRGHLAGTVGSKFTHTQEANAAPVYPAQMRGTFAARNTIEASGSLTAGIRLTVKAWRFTWENDWETTKSDTKATQRDWVATEFIAAAPSSAAGYALATCPANAAPPPPPAVIPTGAPLPSEDESENLVEFATNVGNQISIGYRLCNPSTRTAYDPTQDPNLASQINQYMRLAGTGTLSPTQIATVCAWLDTYFATRLGLCLTGQGKAGLLDPARLTRRRPRCTFT